MSSLGDIVIGLKMDAGAFAAGTRSARGNLQQISDSARATATQFAAVAVAAGAAFAGWAVSLAADAEQAQISFEVLLGSGSAAQSMLNELKQFSATSPFDQIAPREAARTLLNFGVASDQILPTIRMLGDVAAGDAQKLRQLSLVFGQMSATGRLMGQDLLQFINAGFNPLQQISARTGESMIELKSRMEAGGISTQEVRRAFIDATSAGGRFFGMTERQATTLTGLWSTAKDEIVSTVTELGKEIVKQLDLQGMLQDAIFWLKLGSKYVQEYGASIVRVGFVLGAMAGTFAAVSTAIAAARSAMLLYSAVQTVLIAKELTLKAIMGPAAWASVAAGLVAAGIVAHDLASGFSKIEREARASASAIKATQDAAQGGGASAGKGTVAIDQLIALQKRMRELQGWQARGNGPYVAQRAAQNELARVPIRELLGIQQTGQAAAEASPRVKLLRDTLASLNDMRGLIARDEIAALARDINDALREEQDKRSGVTEAIARQREELQKLQDELNPNAERGRLQAAGASDQALTELRQLQQQTEELQRQKKQAEELARAQQTAQEQMQARADRLKESTMTAVEKQIAELNDIRELFIKGFIDEETYNRAVAQTEGKQKKSAQPARAALAGSSDAASILVRGAFGTKSLESLAKQANEIANKQLAATEKLVDKESPEVGNVIRAVNF